MRIAPIDFGKGMRPPAAAGLALTLIGVALLVAALQYLAVLQARGQDFDARDEAISRQERERQAISKAHRNLENPRAAELMALQRYATEPARHLIERGWRPNIALLSIEMATATREINLVFESRTAQEALSFADWLEAQPSVERVEIKRQVEKPGPPVRSVETALQVIWRAYRGGASGATEAGVAASGVAAAKEEAP